MANKNSRATLQQVETVLMGANSTQVKLSELRPYRDQPAKKVSPRSINALRSAALMQRKFANASGSYTYAGSSYGQFIDPQVEAALTFSQTASEEADVVTAQQILDGVNGQGSKPSLEDIASQQINNITAPATANLIASLPRTEQKATAESGVASVVKKYKGLIILVVIAALCYVLFKK